MPQGTSGEKTEKKNEHDNFDGNMDQKKKGERSYKRVRRVGRFTTAVDSSVAILEGTAARLLRAVAGVRADGVSAGHCCTEIVPVALEIADCSRETCSSQPRKH
jgi:hypothetical protein